jgi:hypothetical protein
LANYDEATFLAGQRMLQGETGFTTITAIWKVWWSNAILHVEGIT